MTALVRAELRKYLTTRQSWAMPLTMFVLGALFCAVSGLFLVVLAGGEGTGIPDPTAMLDDLAVARLVYTGAVQMGYLVALVMGILAMGGEYRHRTLTATFLAAPRRGRLIAAKVGALVLVVAGNAVAFLLGSFAGGAPMLALGDAAVLPQPGALAVTALRMVLVLVLWGLIGFGLGVLIPNQVAALFVGVGVTLLVEPLLGFGITFIDQVRDASKFFPSQASVSVLEVFGGMDPQAAQAMGGSGDSLSWWVAGLVLLGYAAVATLLGWWRTQVRDVG
jgi:ABC-2 type transport system permease protein